MIGLIDCNNFYVSCERVFNPKLNDKPVIVLSNNDGCVIARSNQAKSLGIAMGVPFFRIAKFCQQNQVVVFSSNYTLYGDMSLRVMGLLQSLEKNIEIYSIDEAFIYFDKPIVNLLETALQTRKMLLQTTGIPTSIGIAPTKTLAKVANHFAKKFSDSNVVQLTSPAEWQEALAKLSLQDIWGIGNGLCTRLMQLDITTPLALSQTAPKKIRQYLGVVAERIVHELNGIACIVTETPTARKQIIVSRSFGINVTTFADILVATSHHVVRAFEKLRQQKSFVKQMQFFLVYKVNQKEYELQQQAIIYTFTEPTQDTRLAIQAMQMGLEKIFCEKKIYKKSGVILLNLTHANQQINDLFFSPGENIRSQTMMNTIDRINAKYGSNTLMFAPQLQQNTEWKLQANWRSPNYTTRWSELVLVD